MGRSREKLQPTYLLEFYSVLGALTPKFKYIRQPGKLVLIVLYSDDKLKMLKHIKLLLKTKYIILYPLTWVGYYMYPLYKQHHRLVYNTIHVLVMMLMIKAVERMKFMVRCGTTACTCMQ